MSRSNAANGGDASGGASPMLRQISVRVVMEVLLQHGPKSRAELAKITGLSKQTMSEVVRKLEDAGWVREKSILSGGIGRNAIAYEIADDAGFVVGIDAGSTCLRLALADISGAIVAEIEEPSPREGGVRLLERIGLMRERAVAQAGVDTVRILQACVATPGVVDPRSGTLSMAPNMTNLEGLDLRGELARLLGCRLILENDVNCGALGESWRGSGHGAESVAFVSLGTGIGLGMLVDGQLLRGARGAAGEVSYLPFGADPFTPLSLDRGALECALSADGIRQRYRAAGGAADTPVAEILARATAGERHAEVTLHETARIAALLVLSVDAMFDPALILIGGAIGGDPNVFLLLQRFLKDCSHREIVMLPGRLGRRATLVGAIAVALNSLHNRLFNPNDLPGPLRLPTVLGN